MIRALADPATGSGGTEPQCGRPLVTGATCREFKSTVNVDGKQEAVTGTACQQADGTWKVVN